MAVSNQSVQGKRISKKTRRLADVMGMREGENRMNTRTGVGRDWGNRVFIEKDFVST